MLTSRFIASMVSPILAALVAGVASAQNYPSKPIRIVTSAAGGASDFAARIIAQGVSEPLGQPIIVENRQSGIIQGEIVARAPPDGYTLLFATSSHWITSLVQKTPFDPVKDFSSISIVSSQPNILVVHPSLP